jgi:serine/threonine protein kinase
MEIYLDEVKENDVEIPNNHFNILAPIASGSFGQVVHAIDLNDGSEIAVKIIDKRKWKTKLAAIKKEILILQQLNHPNIVKFLGYIETDTHLYIKMEHLKGGTLKALMNRLNENDVSVVLKNLLEAINYLHSRDITHRDIKPDNVMLQCSDDLTTVKLIDFGLSSQDYNELFQYDLCGTIIYMAPEQLDNRRSYGRSVDIWSCGIIMYLLLRGEHPVYTPGLTFNDYIGLMKGFNWRGTGNRHFLSQMAANLLDRLLEIDPGKRYTVDKCLKHPWITRNRYGKIPLTHTEDWKIIAMRNKFRDLISGVIFLNGYKKLMAQENLEPKVPVVYTNLTNRLSHELKLKYILKRNKGFEVASPELMSSEDEDGGGMETLQTEESIKPQVRQQTTIDLINLRPESSMRKKFRSDKSVYNINSKKLFKLKLDNTETTTTLTGQKSGVIKKFIFRKDGLSPKGVQFTDTSTQESISGKAIRPPRTLSKTKTQDTLAVRFSSSNLKTIDDK